MPAHRDIIVIGGSAGAIDPLLRLVSLLPAGLPASVFVVLHIAAASKGELAGLIQRNGSLPCGLAEDGEPIRPGRIYLARPDRHLLIEPGRIAVTHGPKENRARPAIDPLFRSAAAAYGPRVIGVVLSGMLDDGAQGLAAIKRAGGIAVVQHPKEARFPSMPMNASLSAGPDYRLPAGEIPALLDRLVRETPGKAIPVDRAHADEAGDLEKRLLPENVLRELGSPSVFSCPDCGGVLFEIEDSALPRYRCSIGHAFGGQTLMAGKDAAVEEALAASLRAMKAAGIANPLVILGDGRQAVEYLEGRGPYAERERYPLPRLLLLDLKLPMLSGFQVLEWIRGRAATRALPVIILTTSGEYKDINRAYDLGANSFLVKPSGADNLANQMKAFRQFWLEQNTYSQ